MIISIYQKRRNDDYYFRYPILLSKNLEKENNHPNMVG